MATIPIGGPYDIGDKPAVTATFADVTGGAATATTIAIITRDPNGVETSYPTGHASVTNPASNVWKLALPILTVAGRWSVRAKATSAIVAAEEGVFFVNQTEFTTP